jgi:hypothetical protein
VIVLDTNVLSALMIREPEEVVLRWLGRQPQHELWTTSITLFELRLGIERLVTSRRRAALEAAFDGLVDDDLEGRILDFDAAAARQAGRLAAKRQRAGRPVDLRDTEIAGIVLARNATLASRNVRHFADLDVTVVDPWGAGAPSATSRQSRVPQT